MREIVGLASKTGAQVRTLPAVSDMIVGRGVLKQLRDVDFADLLRRNPMQVDPSDGPGYIAGEVVVITGGGGSIGGELARQIARLRPAQLILVGKGENSLFEIEQHLILEGHVPPVTIVADVRDRASMEAIFRKYSPTVVFHAAAHKHVPLMQSNPIEAIRNNIWGTYQTADLAVKYGAKKFILVSTDKAVNPTNVMGATKRVAELIVGELAAKAETDFAVVRFGNVLGSRGSLIPALKMQIQRGGPVRVTHPDMMRFFMTIPEAAQLIVQAGVFGKRGEIFILDMGEPMRVLDVAKDIIRLHGLEPDVTMPIVFTGTRPGEKLNEELTYDSETTGPTPHAQIMVLNEKSRHQGGRVLDSVNALMEVCGTGDVDLARQFLMEFAWQGSLPQRAVVNLGITHTPRV
jgi:FlaA1/EpsC-like NDP-sugar epimerase